MYVQRCWNPFPNPGLNTSMNSRHACCSIIPLCSHIINNYAEILKSSSKQLNKIFTGTVLLALTKPRNFSPRVTLPPIEYILQTLHTRRLVHVLKHQLLHRQRKQSIQSYSTLLQFFRTISSLISIILFCMSGDVYFIIELGTELSRQDCSISSCLEQFGYMTENCHGITFAIGMPNCNILTITKNTSGFFYGFSNFFLSPSHYLFLAISSLC